MFHAKNSSSRFRLYDYASSHNQHHDRGHVTNQYHFGIVCACARACAWMDGCWLDGWVSTRALFCTLIRAHVYSEVLDVYDLNLIGNDCYTTSID